jgi:hypothetical protein
MLKVASNTIKKNKQANILIYDIGTFVSLAFISIIQINKIQEAECDDIFNIYWIMFLLLILKMHCYFVLAFISIRE